jgi:DNA-binding MarR family transcriptional regulator
MTKRFTIENSELKHKVSALCFLKFKGLSATEEAVLSWFVAGSVNSAISVDKSLTKQITHELNISQSSLSTSIFRLQEKGVIKKSGKVIILNPIFNDITNMDNLIISFS